MGDRRHKIQSIRAEDLSVADPRPVQQRYCQLLHLGQAGAFNGNGGARQSFCKDFRQDKSHPALRLGLAVPAQAIPTNADSKGYPAEHQPKRQLSGQRSD